MERRDLRSCNPMVEVSSPSMLMLPPAGSMMRNKLNVRELFPAPVRPTMPTFSLGLISRLMSFNTRSSPSLYRVEKLRNTTAPSAGQLDGGLLLARISGASLRKLEYSNVRSTETMFAARKSVHLDEIGKGRSRYHVLSTSTVCRTIQFKDCVIWSA